jgi:hypothetical protein
VTKEERTAFLVAIELTGWLEPIPLSWRVDLERRVEGQRAAAAKHAEFDETVSKLLRRALAQQKTAKNKNTVAPEVASALNAINNLLIKHGRDLNEIIGLQFDRATTIEKPAKAA